MRDLRKADKARTPMAQVYTDLTDKNHNNSVFLSKNDKKMTKKVLFLALTNTDFLPRTNADFLPRITGGGRPP